MRQITQTKVLILLGPPGAGKGSQAALLKENLHLAHISTGDLLRAAIQKKSALGQKAKTFMDQGQLVPDELMFAMLFERISEPDCANGFILDGFPRTVAQAEELERRLDHHEVKVLSLTLEDAHIVERLTKRLICSGCQTPYHLLFAKPREEGKCDRCGEPLFQRSDDTEAVVKERLKVYHEKTAPLIAFYQKQGTLESINANQDKETVLSEIRDFL